MATTSHSNSYCEAWIQGEWKVVPVEAARVRPATVVRCLECHGPIVLMQAGRNNTTRAHAEHRPGHAGCSLGYYFNGVREPHPQQIQAPTEEALPSEQEIVIEDDESAFPEGKEKFRQHRYRERDGKIVQRAKAQRLAETGKLECEVCDIDFDRCYGERGRGFIEAHHKIPVSQLDGKKKTRIEDLALVCSNCHRMLHRGVALVSVEQLKDELARKCQPIGPSDASC